VEFNKRRGKTGNKLMKRSNVFFKVSCTEGGENDRDALDHEGLGKVILFQQARDGGK